MKALVAARDVLARIESRLPDASAFALFKILYYCQAWHLAWEGRPLFPERIEAWTNGPVVADAWRERKRDEVVSSRELPDQAKYEVDAIVAFYGHMTGGQLVDLTHDEGPWLDARGDLPVWAKSEAEVTPASMRRFYSRMAIRSDISMPRRPQVDTISDKSDALAIAAREAPRWRETLERLAQ